MRRKDKEVTSREWMMEVLEDAEWLGLAMAGADGWPYLIPLNYGYGDDFLIIHGARDGKKIDLIRENNKVAFNVSINNEVVRNEEDPSEFSMKYKSVSGRGIASFIEDPQEKKEALQILMEHYKGPKEPLRDDTLGRTSVIRIQITEMTGKISFYNKPKE